MLPLPNMKQVLGPSMWMWPFPFAPHIKGEGIYFPRLPDVSSTNLSNSNKGYTREDFEMPTESYVEKAKQKYGGSTFVVKTDEHPEGKLITI